MIDPNQRRSLIQDDDGAVASLAEELSFADQPV
jgi:hypothetical protein